MVRTHTPIQDHQSYFLLTVLFTATTTTTTTITISITTTTKNTNTYISTSTAVQVFEQFYRDSFFFRYLLGLSSTLRCVSNLGDLWFREGFLQDTGCIQVSRLDSQSHIHTYIHTYKRLLFQFPIELSLPWVLTEHLISSPNRVINPPMMQNVLYILDIYNGTVS